jgi:hypothetical protein
MTVATKLNSTDNLSAEIDGKLPNRMSSLCRGNAPINVNPEGGGVGQGQGVGI